MNTETATLDIQSAVTRLQLGDAEAAEVLLEQAYARIRRMTSRLANGYPSVRRWEETDDICQKVAVQIHRRLTEQPPKSAAHFFALVAQQIRWTLIEAIRKLQGPCGIAAHHDSQGSRQLGGGLDPRNGLEADTNDPVKLADWGEFHAQIERLPEEARGIFDLIWYGGLSHEDSANTLGISTRTVKRRWREARLLLSGLRDGSLPGERDA